MAALQHVRNIVKGNIGHRLSLLPRLQQDSPRVSILPPPCAQISMVLQFSAVERLNLIQTRTLASLPEQSSSTGSSSSMGGSREQKFLKGSKAAPPSAPSYANPFDPSLVENLLNNMEGDLPSSEMPDPFEKDYHRCFICRHNIQLDHKNVRLLSQFVSPHTGRIYGRQITGLCIPMQRHVSHLIKRARASGFMPIIIKDPKYLLDPPPYDPMSKRQ